MLTGSSEIPTLLSKMTAGFQRTITMLMLQNVRHLKCRAKGGARTNPVIPTIKIKGSHILAVTPFFYRIKYRIN